MGMISSSRVGMKASMTTCSCINASWCEVTNEFYPWPARCVHAAASTSSAGEQRL